MCKYSLEIICDACNKIFDYKGGIAHYKRSKTGKHYCSYRCLAEGNRKYPELHNKNNKRYGIWSRAKKRAKLKKMEFSLSLDDIPAIPPFCPVLGIAIKANTQASPLDSSPSLDRIDASKGYIPGNVRIISNRANRIRADATIEEIRRILEDFERIQG